MRLGDGDDSTVAPGLALDDFRRRFRLTRDELWIRYIALGGTLGPADLVAYLTGARQVDAVQHNTIGQVLNEAALDAGEGQPVPDL